MKLKCADLFCGAGGFSEGFRQAGFHVTAALDNWAPAVLTHEKNHPETRAINGDILKFEPDELGPVDVLIGSPPCTEFSFANRGGGGDIEAGLRLIYRFLRFVYELKPKYWVMENVPRTLDFLPEEVPLRKLGIDKKGVLEIPVRTVFVSADFGVPQKRARAFSGDFPVPMPTHAETARSGQQPWRTLFDVVNALGNPLLVPQLGEVVRDPVYGFGLPAHELIDHYSDDLVLTDEEVRENRKAKEDHSWYGRMVFPDDLDRPARTVMATQLRVSRETTVIAASSGGYRRLSVREASSVQAFPITYQWWGKSQSLRYKLVGNAVAPPVAHAIAKAILQAERRKIPERPIVVERVALPAPVTSDERQKPRHLPLDRKFREHIPGSKVAGFRVDLDNHGSRPGLNPGWRLKRSRPPHIVEWRAVLYRGSGKAVRSEAVSLGSALRRLAAGVSREGTAEKRAWEFINDLSTQLAPFIPDATTLQAVRAERTRSTATPYVLLDLIAQVVDRHYGSPQKVIHIASVRSAEFVPQRVAATLVATAFACTVANEGTLWLEVNRQQAFAADPSWRIAPAMRSIDLPKRIETAFRKELSRRPKGRRARDNWTEVEQLTISGA
jgi:DNA (cytosine-5)-methyltransferase 1